ncbi:pr107 [rat cytomegalovirus strain Maastricht]|uniref:Pr107 n=1 Tax=Rat cytomegalovirus (strain Maastricht) TaxID=79700 RepID=Q9DW94_RCMVM|nr:pr107 [rat cytomegalovirus strain Maastricht]AAF99196.1 pr107 [rat cytomegalovirus strain Maastricht]
MQKCSESRPDRRHYHTIPVVAPPRGGMRRGGEDRTPATGPPSSIFLLSHRSPSLRRGDPPLKRFAPRAGIGGTGEAPVAPVRSARAKTSSDRRPPSAHIYIHTSTRALSLFFIYFFSKHLHKILIQLA